MPRYKLSLPSLLVQCWLLLYYTLKTCAIPLDIDDPNSIRDASTIVARGIMDYYPPYFQSPGAVDGYFTDSILDGNSYWWIAGSAFGSLINYWHYTGDDQYNSLVMDGILNQVGPDWDFMPTNESITEGNDDQSFWAITAMSAAEFNFPNPPNGSPQWLYLAQAVFNDLAIRWDNSTCAGGLRWQIYSFNTGYEYKNSITNGCFLHLAARLYRYTNEDIYRQWAYRIWDWVESIGLIDDNGLAIYDGTFTSDNCSAASINVQRFSYIHAMYISSTAYMYNTTLDYKWLNHTLGLLEGFTYFLTDNNTIMYEPFCELQRTCDTDQLSFRALNARFLTLAGTMIRSIAPVIKQVLSHSAIAAAESCDGGSDGVTCSGTWLQPTWDGSWGLGQQMSALEVIQGNLFELVYPPLTESTGATSQGSLLAGTLKPSDLPVYSPITKGDRAGASILTAAIIIWLIGVFYWMA